MQHPKYISDYRKAVAGLLDAFEVARNLYVPYEKLALGNALTDEDFTYGNSDITKQEFIDAVVSMQAFEAAFQTLAGAGHLTNLYRMTA